jgi:hypothetical protein
VGHVIHHAAPTLRGRDRAHPSRGEENGAAQAESFDRSSKTRKGSA